MNIIVTILLWTTYFLSLYFAIFWFLVFLDDTPATPKRKFKKYPTVSVVIPAYNEEDSIKETIASVLRLDYSEKLLEIIVVNDGSTDKTENIIKSVISDNKTHKISLISQENKGKGAALNAGLEVSKGEYFICLDADSFVEKDTLKKILPHFTHDNIAAVLPTLKVKNPKNILQKIQWYEYLVNMFYKELMSKLNCVHVAPGPFSVYRKDILKTVGGFDPDRNLTEDLEITLRLQSYHYEIIQLLDTTVYTIAPDNLKELYYQRNRWYKGAIFNAIKHRKMMFNRKYGDFGMIQMPTIIISGILAIILIASLIYYSLKPHVKLIYNLSYVGFDFITLLKNFTLNLNILDVDYTLLLIGIIMMTITFIIFRKSHLSTNERVLKFGIVSILYYVFLYFMILGVMWIGISIDILFGKKQKW